MNKMNKTNTYRCGFRDGWNAYVQGCAQGLPPGLAEREPLFAIGHEDGYEAAETVKAEHQMTGLPAIVETEGATA